MRTEQRLDQCYRKAKKLKINKDSRIIFFSDVHRGDNSLSDEFAHNQNIYSYALEHYYNEGFTYIEVGDGDELLEYPKFKYIRSAHSDTYMKLRQFHKDNRLIYMYGNHNVVLKNHFYVQRHFHYFYDDYLDRTNDLFLNIDIHESLILECEKSKQQILVVHGHQGDLFNDQLYPISMVAMRVLWRHLHKLGFKNPASPAKNRTKRHKIERNFSKWILDRQVGILCGHTHRPKLPDFDAIPYLNSGCCIHPRGITGIELVAGDFSLVYWYIKPDEDGKLKITRKVMRGPIHFSDYKLLKENSHIL